MKYKALFLDLDGTILNTLKDIAFAVNYSLKKHNLPLKSDEQIRTYLGNGSNFLIHQAMDNQNEDIFDSVFDVYKKYYLSHPSDFTKPYEGVVDLLKEYKAKGGKIALVSNKPHDIAIKLIDQFFPGLFDTIYGQKDNVKRKPDPASVYLAMKDLNITNKKDILYVGDSLVDASTASNAGVCCILCKYGFENPDKLLDKSKTYINKFDELKGYLY